MAVSNAFLLYKKTGGKQPHIWFRTQVIHSLLSSQDRSAEPTIAPRALGHHKASDLSRLEGQHYMDVIPPTEKKAAPTTKCVVCNKHGKRKETRYICETCPSKPALCVVPCFKQFHSCADFWRSGTRCNAKKATAAVSKYVYICKPQLCHWLFVVWTSIADLILLSKQLGLLLLLRRWSALRRPPLLL